MYYITTYSYLILPLAFLLLKCKLKDRGPVVIALYGIICFLCLSIYYDLSKDAKRYFQPSYTFLEYIFFTYIFWFNAKNKLFKAFIIIASALFFVFQIIFAIYTPKRRLDSIPIGIETILLFVFVFYFFYEFSKQVKDTFIYNHYTFWFAVGILIYLGGSFFFYILINELDTNQVENFGNFTYIAEIIKNILFAFSIFMFKKHPVNKTHNPSKNIPNLDMI